MLEPLIIRKKTFMPFVYFDKEKSIFRLEGKSIPEDSTEFYPKIFAWLEEYVKNPNKKTVLVLKLDYYNSSSARDIANIIKFFDALYKKGHEVEVKWIYNSDDEVMRENGEDFKILFTVPIEIIIDNS